MKDKKINLAFIDGQNLHLGTTENNWKINHLKLRTYLKDKISMITPNPGGVGPMTIAMLMKNIIKAYVLQAKSNIWK